MADQSAMDLAINRAYALLGAREDWPAARSLLGRFQIGDLRVLVQVGERMRRIELYPGERCESSTDACPCGPVEYHDAEGVPLCADCYDTLQAEWESLPICAACGGSDEDCPTCDGLGRVYPGDEEADASTTPDVATPTSTDASVRTPVAWVPVHPTQGPLWSMATNVPHAERLPSYPLMALYGDIAAPEVG